MNESDHSNVPFVITAIEFAIAVAVSLYIISSLTENYLGLSSIFSGILLSLLCIPICLLLYRAEDDRVLLDTFAGLIALFIIQTLSGTIWYLVPLLTGNRSIEIFGMSLMAAGYLPIIAALYQVLKRQKLHIGKRVLASGAAIGLAGAVALFFAVATRSGSVEAAFASVLLYLPILSDLFVIAVSAVLVLQNRNSRRKYVFTILFIVFLVSLVGDSLSEIATIGLADTLNLAQLAYAVMLLFLTVSLLFYSLTSINLVVLNRVSRELKDTRRLVGDLLAHTPDAMGITDVRGDLDQANEKFLALLDQRFFTGGRFNIFRDSSSLFGPEVGEHAGKLLLGRAAVLRNVRYWRPENRGERYLSLKMFPTYSSEEGVSGYAIIAEDVTELKQADDALRKARDELEIRVVERTADLEQANAALQRERLDLKRSNEELEQFAYIASHDLQEPLRMVNSYVKLIDKRYRGKLDCDADDYLQYVVDGTARMQLMIADLRHYSRVDTKVRAFKQVDLETAFQKIEENLQVAIRESNATVTHTPLPTVLGDNLQLMHVFQNLVSNAIKYRGDRAPVIHVSAEKADEEWTFSVRDNGIGIDPQYFSKLFIIFHRLHNHTEYSGNGIGLAICKKIIAHHGGRIWVESVPGEGSEFKFTIPCEAEVKTTPQE